MAGKRHREAGYSAPSDTTPRSLRMTLPGYGEVDIDFEAQGDRKRLPLPRGCTGTPSRRQKGVWKGDIALTTSYTEVEKHRAEGHLLFPGEFECEPRPPKEYATLFGFRAISGTSTYFTATRFRRPSALPAFYASEFFKDGGTDVALAAKVRGERPDFEFSLTGDTAHVEPPRPFSGTGDFDGGTWTGDLTAKVPGGSLDLITAMNFDLGNFPPP